MTDDLVKCLRDSCYLAFDDGTNDYGTAEEAADRIEKLEAALRKADEFITNGIELGYIRMPDPDTPDPAHQTPHLIRIEKLEAALTHIYTWYPISVSEPIKTIHEIRDYARKALEGKDD